MEQVSLAYAEVVDRIRTGISGMKGVSLTPAEITESTAFWLTDGPEQPCLSFDSLDFLELVVLLEEEFGWSIPEDEIDVDEVRTVGDLAELVVKNVPAAS